MVFTYTYYCGVNISGQSDPICNSSGGLGESGCILTLLIPVTDNPRAGTPDYEDWGTANSITVFPMYELSVHWSTGDTANMKYRGWDTLRLCHVDQTRCAERRRPLSHLCTRHHGRLTNGCRYLQVAPEPRDLILHKWPQRTSYVLVELGPRIGLLEATLKDLTLCRGCDQAAADRQRHSSQRRVGRYRVLIFLS